MATTDDTAGTGTNEDAAQAADALATRLVESATGALEVFSLYLGRALGLYRAVAAAGSRGFDVDELAAETGIDARYAKEWLEQQAVAGFLRHDGGRWSMPPGHADVLIQQESAAYVAPVAEMVVGIAGVLPQLPDAYREGRGIPYADYGPTFRAGQGAMNRPAFAGVGDWLATMPDILGRLQRDGATVADLGCGEGWSTVALAKALPAATVRGFDLDPGSVDAAQRVVADAGVGDRVEVVVADGLGDDASYDLVLIFEALHDMARPVDVLRAARRGLADGGAVLVVDERVADAFGEGIGDLVERMMYGWSVTHCLPASMAEMPSAALGTVLRRETVFRMADDAGFSATSELPVENDFFRFYRLDA